MTSLSKAEKAQRTKVRKEVLARMVYYWNQLETCGSSNGNEFMAQRTRKALADAGFKPGKTTTNINKFLKEIKEKKEAVYRQQLIAVIKAANADCIPKPAHQVCRVLRIRPQTSSLE